MDWLRYASPQSQATFREISAFMAKNSAWPLQGTLQRAAEEAIPTELDPHEAETVFAWFQKHPPLSTQGIIKYARLLLGKGLKKQAQRLVQKAWTEQVLDNQKAVLREHRSLLTPQDHFMRCDLLLLQNKPDLAESLLSELKPHHRKIIQLRLDIAQGKKDPDTVFQEIGPADHSQPGMLYERIQWHCSHRNNEEVITLLASFPESSRAKYQQALWKIRNLITRRLLEAKDFQAAYDLVKNHGLSQGEDFANAEWLAGWLSLSFLKQPLQAKNHLERLYNNVSSPISKARGAFWIGECEVALKHKDKAQLWYQKAMANPTTFYGQLAASRLKRQLDTLSFSTPADALPPYNEVRVIQLLYLLKCTSTMEPFLLSLAEHLKDPQEQKLFVEFAARSHSPYAGVWMATKSAKAVFPVVNAAYPLLKSHKKLPLPALAHAITIRESRFNPQAQSSAGALGMMQLMPATAAETIKKFNLKSGSLFDPQHNVQVGTKHLEELHKLYGGNLILICCAYNAGPVVEKWIQEFGDPRDPQTDVLKWIEMIPYGQTRDYVQRVLESYVVYRKRLSLPFIDLSDILHGKTD